MVSLCITACQSAGVRRERRGAYCGRPGGEYQPEPGSEDDDHRARGTENRIGEGGGDVYLAGGGRRAGSAVGVRQGPGGVPPRGRPRQPGATARRHRKSVILECLMGY